MFPDYFCYLGSLRKMHRHHTTGNSCSNYYKTSFRIKICLKIFPDFFRYLDSVVGCIAELFTPLLIRPSVPVHTIGHICHPNPNRTSPQPNTHHVTRSFSKHIIPKYVPSLITHVCPTPSKHVIPKKILHTYPSKHISVWSLVSNSYQ